MQLAVPCSADINRVRHCCCDVLEKFGSLSTVLRLKRNQSFSWYARSHRRRPEDGQGVVSGRVALLLRSTEIKPPSSDLSSTTATSASGSSVFLLADTGGSSGQLCSGANEVNARYWKRARVALLAVLKFFRHHPVRLTLTE